MRWLTVATIIAAIGSFAVLFLSAWTLGTRMNLEFTAYWGLFFALTGVLGGLMQETTRAVGSERAAVAAIPTTAPLAEEFLDGPADASGDADAPHTGARPIVIAAGVAACTFAIFVLTGPLWMHLIVADHVGWAVVLLAAGLSSYAMQAAVSGLLAGAGLWGHYAALIVIDILVRVVPAALAFVFGWGLVAFLLITVVGAASWVPLVLASPAARRAVRGRADVPARRFVVLMVTAMGASGASALLVTGFPTLVKLADDYGASGAGPLSEHTVPVAAVTAAGIAYAVSLTRAPLLMPLEKFQNAIIVHFVQSTSQPFASLLRPLGLLVGFGVFGACVAWPVGPWILQILPGDYMIPGVGLFALTIGATTTAVLMVTGSVMLATNHHRAYLVGWIAATAIAAALLFAPGALLWRTAAALIIGPLASAVSHLVILRRDTTAVA
ncbi:hypothetical protein KRX51_01050 [Corynebacterium sp. TAE3-ERU12]|uniref:hypothetical protein n=1 Tax=Corynebacterium sp. TAE3-ERU12 TaxID=2849491 RepID=UPI001C43E29F|nr:hypothetical protein [Corynebacterium sp. TAE3-ERU12]MBV7294505.1 hypothetical protein [Corynebacterium sp. TAE3-ERU12]